VEGRTGMRMNNVGFKKMWTQKESLLSSVCGNCLSLRSLLAQEAGAVNQRGHLRGLVEGTPMKDKHFQ
jgi:hypothetical protein